MYNHEGFEQWFKMNRNMTAPFNEFNKITTELWKHVTQQHLEVIEENFSLWSDQMNRLANVKKPEDFANYLKECTNENIHMALQHIQKLIHTSMKNMEEFSKIGVPFREATKPMEKEREKTR